MAMMLMPCVVFSGGVRLVIIAIYCTVDHAGTIHPCSRYRYHVWCLFSRHHEPDTYAHDTDAVCGVLDTHGTDTHAADTDTMCGILFWWYSISMAMMLMPFPCPMVTVTDAHGTDAH